MKKTLIFFTMPSKVEGTEKQTKANEILNRLKVSTNKYELFNNDSLLADTDNKIIEQLDKRIYK